MKTIRTVDELDSYIIRLGFCCQPGFPGWILQAQADLRNVAEALTTAAGIPEGKLENYPAYDVPFKVQFRRYRSENGYSYPWLGEFTVIGANGRQKVPCSRIGKR